MKWVPTSPFVVAPQIASRRREPRRCGIAPPSRAPAPPSRRFSLLRGGCAGSVPAGAPYGVTPRSAGELRNRVATSGTTDSAMRAMRSDASRHEVSAATPATTGRKISWPVALPAVRTPTTSRDCGETTAPRRSRRTRAPSTPCRGPTSTPQVRTSIQLSVTKTLSAAPAATATSATLVTRRMPNRSMSAAANGAVSP